MPRTGKRRKSKSADQQRKRPPVDLYANAAPTQRLQRLLRLIVQVQSARGDSAVGLAESLGVSRRTVFRDLKLLQDARVPVRHIPGRGYHLDPEFQAALQDFGASEMLGLMLMSKIAQALPEQPLLRPANDAVMKIIAQLPSTVRGFYQELLRSVTFAPGAAREDPAVPARFSLLQRCMEEHTICHVRYTPVPPHEPFAGRVHPLHLHFYKHSWFVIAFSEPHDEVRMFNLSRFQDITVTDEFFPPMPFDINAYLGDAWGIIPGSDLHDVAVRFTPRVARNVTEIRWHHSQQVDEQPDGSCIVRFRVNGLDEIKWWIIGYGDQAEVLEPVELRQQITAMIRSMLSQYGNTTKRRTASSTAG